MLRLKRMAATRKLRRGIFVHGGHPNDWHDCPNSTVFSASKGVAAVVRRQLMVDTRILGSKGAIGAAAAS